MTNKKIFLILGSIFTFLCLSITCLVVVLIYIVPLLNFNEISYFEKSLKNSSIEVIDSLDFSKISEDEPFNVLLTEPIRKYFEQQQQSFNIAQGSDEKLKFSIDVESKGFNAFNNTKIELTGDFTYEFESEKIQKLYDSINQTNLEYDFEKIIENYPNFELNLKGTANISSSNQTLELKVLHINQNAFLTIVDTNIDSDEIKQLIGKTFKVKLINIVSKLNDLYANSLNSYKISLNIDEYPKNFDELIAYYNDSLVDFLKQNPQYESNIEFLQKHGNEIKQIVNESIQKTELFKNVKGVKPLLNVESSNCTTGEVNSKEIINAYIDSIAKIIQIKEESNQFIKSEVNLNKKDLENFKKEALKDSNLAEIGLTLCSSNYTFTGLGFYYSYDDGQNELNAKVEMISEKSDFNADAPTEFEDVTDQILKQLNFYTDVEGNMQNYTRQLDAYDIVMGIQSYFNEYGEYPLFTQVKEYIDAVVIFDKSGKEFYSLNKSNRANNVQLSEDNSYYCYLYQKSSFGFAYKDAQENWIQLGNINSPQCDTPMRLTEEFYFIDFEIPTTKL